MYYAKPYGLTRDELRYILDRNDVYGSDFLGETFRVLVTEFFSPKQEEIAFVIPGTPYLTGFRGHHTLLKKAWAAFSKLSFCILVSIVIPKKRVLEHNTEGIEN
jgi:hypothetical protein